MLPQQLVRLLHLIIPPVTGLTKHYAAAAAAKINAQLQARKGIQHVDVPPIKSSDSTGAGDVNAGKPGNLNREVYVSDGDYIKDIEVNDLRNRYLLTKGSTQKMVNNALGQFLLIHFRKLAR